MSIVVQEDQRTIPDLIGASEFLPDADSPFFMSKEEWVDLQIYVAVATSLPTTKQAVRDVLGLGNEETFKFTVSMAGVFAAMNEHCHTWQSETYPDVVVVAHRISEYATKFPAHTTALRHVIEQIASAMRDDDDYDAIVERYFVTIDRLVQRLLDETRENQSLARQTSDKISRFADQTDDDRAALTKLDRDATKEGGVADEEVQQVQAQIDAIFATINSLQKEYTVSVVVAATTPTYLLVPIIGWIAIPIVAPIFGVRAGKLQQSISELRSTVGGLEESIAQKVRLKALLTLTKNHIGPIKEKAEAAQAVIDKAYGIWESIAVDIAAIPGTLRSIVSEGVDPDALLMQMDMDTAVDQWAKVGTEADQFRVNAFVRFIEPGAPEADDS